MMKRTIFFLLLSAFLFSGSTLKDNRLRPDKDFALFFAVNDYDHWEDLANPISEVEAIAKDLKDLYGFETEVVRNPDRKTILDKIEEYRKKTYAKDAQLLIFFSGHGEFNEDIKQGYFVPKDGKKEDSYGDSYIEYEGLKRRISTLSCEHILLALDACYSGTADADIAMRGKPGVRPGTNKTAERDQYISTSLQYKSRLIVTSGAKVRTPDKSQFAIKFLEALQTQDDDFQVVNFDLLVGHLKTASPKPMANSFEGNETGGEFLFILKTFNVSKPYEIKPEKPIIEKQDTIASPPQPPKKQEPCEVNQTGDFCIENASGNGIIVEWGGRQTFIRNREKECFHNVRADRTYNYVIHKNADERSVGLVQLTVGSRHQIQVKACDTATKVIR
ncbi:MAG TPA: caspase family protein [Saprospiraceae bacterium]|nr:caspase family protein [Saprospiraceae bacterium]